MLLNKPLPPSLSADAVNCSCFIRNRIPCKIDATTGSCGLVFQRPELVTENQLQRLFTLEQHVWRRFKTSELNWVQKSLGIEVFYGDDGSITRHRTADAIEIRGRVWEWTCAKSLSHAYARLRDELKKS